MKKCRVLFDRLKEDGKRLPVPENLKPEWMEETIKEHTRKREIPSVPPGAGSSGLLLPCRSGAAGSVPVRTVVSGKRRSGPGADDGTGNRDRIGRLRGSGAARQRRAGAAGYASVCGKKL